MAAQNSTSTMDRQLLSDLQSTTVMASALTNGVHYTNCSSAGKSRARHDQSDTGVIGHVYLLKQSG